MSRLTKRVGAGEAIPVAEGDICAPFIKSGLCKTGCLGGVFSKWERHCNDECVLGMMIDRLAEYENIGPPSDLIWPVRCGECRYYCEYDDWSRKHLEFYKARYCTYLKKDLGFDGYCSAGERRQSDDS